MTTLNELPTKEELKNNDNFLVSDENNQDAKTSLQDLKDFIAPAATETRAGVVTTEAQSFSGDKDFKGDVNFSGAITQNGQPLITDVEISEEEGNALEKKEDGLYVDASSSWTGTQEEFDALDKSTLKDGQQINILDDNANYAGVDRVIENGHNENGYYRKWESGLIEQWGNGNTTNNTILPINFTNNLYVVSSTPKGLNYTFVMLVEQTTNYFKLSPYKAASGATQDIDFCWHAIGY